MPGGLIRQFTSQADWQSGTAEGLDLVTRPGDVIPTPDYLKEYLLNADWNTGTKNQVTVASNKLALTQTQVESYVEVSRNRSYIESSHYGGYEASRAFDGDTTTDTSRWQGVGITNQWVGVDFDVDPQIVTHVRMMGRINYANNPKNFRVEGSDNGADWATIYTGVMEKIGGWQEWTFVNATPYRYYRIFCVDIHGGDTYTILMEVQFCVYQSDQYASPGTWTSPWLAHGISSPQSGLVSLRAETPSGTGVIPHVRYSSDGGSTYTDWHDLDDRRMTDLQGTHVQLRLTLATDDPRQTPVVDRAMLLVGKLHRWTSPVIDLTGVGADAALMLATSQTELDVVREVREGPNFTFSRSSTAYNPETGAEVAVNEPRYVDGPFAGRKALYVEEGTINLVPDVFYTSRVYGQLYPASSWGGDAGEVYYYGSGGYGDLPYKKLIKTAGGTGGSYIDDHFPIRIEDNKTYVISCWLKASRDITLRGYVLCLNRRADNIYRVPSFGFSLTTEWQRFSWIYQTGTGHAGDYQARHIIYEDDNLPLEVYWCGFQAEEKPYATSFHPGTRSYEVTTIPTSGVLSPQEGTIECWFYVQDVTAFKAATYRQIFEVNGGTGYQDAISLYYIQSSDWFNLKTSNGTTASYAYCSASDLTAGWHYIAGRWKSSESAVILDGVKGAGIAVNPSLPASLAQNADIGQDEGTCQVNGPIADLRISNRARSDEEILAAYQSGEPLPVDEHTTYKMAGGPWESVGAVFPCSARRSMQIRLTLARTGFGDQYLSELSIFETLILQMLEEPKPQIRPPDVTHVICYVEDSEPLIEVTASLPGVPEDKRIEVRISAPAGSSEAYAQAYANAYLAVHGVEKRSLTCRIPICTRIGFAELVAVAYKPWGRGLDNPWPAMVQEITHYPLAEIPATELVVGDYQPDDTEALVQLIVRGG